MVTIKPSDYYSLTYDAAAQNKVDELVGNVYERVLAEKSATLTVPELHTVRTGATFTPGTWNQQFLRENYDFQLMDGATYVYALAGQTVSGGGRTCQYTALADYEVVFSQLNLPDEATLAVEIQPEIISKRTHYHDASTSDASMLEYLDDDGYMPTSGFYNCESNKKFCLTSATRWNATYGEEVNLATADSKIIEQTTVGVPPFSNVNAYPTSAYEGIAQEDMEKVWSAANLSGVWHYRAFRNFYNHTLEKLDRDTVRVRGRMPVATMHEADVYSSSPSKSLHMGVLEKLNVKLTYQQMAWNGIPSNYFAENSQKRYPYKFSNERLANTKDKVGNKLWSDYYPQLIFGKYSGGCYYVRLKVRAKFMLVNDLHIDSRVQIYDLKGKLISRNNQPCIFKIKRIIKSYANAEFTYTINCLEE